MTGDFITRFRGLGLRSLGMGLCWTARPSGFRGFTRLPTSMSKGDVRWRLAVTRRERNALHEREMHLMISNGLRVAEQHETQSRREKQTPFQRSKGKNYCGREQITNNLGSRVSLRS